MQKTLETILSRIQSGDYLSLVKGTMWGRTSAGGTVLEQLAQHLQALDRPTKISLVLSLLACLYILLVALSRVGRMLSSVLLFLLQVSLLLAVLYGLATYWDQLSGRAASLLGRNLPPPSTW